MNSIREYLCREAGRITDAAGRRFKSKKELLAARGALRAQYLEMMGITDLAPAGERAAPPVTVTGRTEREAYTVERLHYESLPRLHVSANLYVPKGLKKKAPAVLYVCGHSPQQKLRFQGHARRWAELGFVTLIVDTVQLGEVRGYHHGTYAKGWFHWVSRGYTPAGVECLNAIRGLDLLAARGEVDAARMGVTGISGGGATTWWLAAADERVAAAASVCGTGTLRSHLAERTLDGHCDCMYFVNYYGWDLADLGALVAPRPLLVASADRDGIYSIASIRECCERASAAYALLGAEERLRLVETPGPHSYHESSRRAIFSWFLKHLCGKDEPPASIEDVDESEGANIPDAELLVYVAAPPPDERTAVIQDSFVPLAAAPRLESRADLDRERTRVLEALRTRTFRHFPETPCALDHRVAFEWAHEGTAGRRFHFTPEEGWRLAGRMLSPEGVRGRKAPVFLQLDAPALPGETPDKFLNRRVDRFWAGLDPGWHRMEFEPRGVGESSWSRDLDWHVRRGCAVTGRTLASMRVHDALRAIELARSLDECDGTVALAGFGEMAAVALYAALLDGKARAVVLGEAPATQDAPSSMDGTGPAIEMLGVLRFTDLAVAAGLLYPAELVFYQGRPDSYGWAEDLYARLGPPGRVTHVRNLADWRPQPE